MQHFKGFVTRVVQCGGCVDVTVVGEKPGRFAIANALMWALVDAYGADWTGRQVEYLDGHFRFLDCDRDEFGEETS